MKKDLISILEMDKAEIAELFELTRKIKEEYKKGKKHQLLQGKTLGMIFHKPSTRTRVSFETGMYQLGGNALFLSGNELQLRRGETIEDTARTLSRYVDGIMIRTFSHQDALDLASSASIPVINGLTDREHPCQVLSDAYTIIENRGGALDSKLSALAGTRVAYVGDGNNVANSWIHLASRLGIELRITSPEKYMPDPGILKEVSSPSNITVTSSVEEAVSGADVVYTDVWASMGKDIERAQRLEAFRPYQVNDRLVSLASRDCVVMHCLPAHRGEEITDEVMDGEHSIVFDQAENRLHVQKGIMVMLMTR